MIAYFYIDKKGRRWLLILSLAAMFPFLLATAFSFQPGNSPQNPDNSPRKSLVALFLVCYTMVSLSPKYNLTLRASIAMNGFMLVANHIALC